MRERYDHLVIGSGLAGLTYALKAAENGTVAVLTKARIADSNTTWAQGGIAAAIGESDSWRLHEEDTLKAGGGLNDPEAVRHLVQKAPELISWLQSMGARFDFNDVMQLDLGREGGHSRHRIVHHADRTGWEVERTVTQAVRKNSRIEVFENAFATELLLDEGRCVGAAAMLPDLGLKQFGARSTLVATGGCGQLYQHTTNPRVATADGIALASKAGAEIRQMEFMQFHPTTLMHPQLRGFLITEACRGAGGLLRNHRGRRFMFDYDERLELAPRDVVSRSIEREMARLDTWCVYLDLTHLEPEMLEREFPTIWSRLRELDIEIEKEWIPVVPAQHYSCGGIVTDLDGRTNVPGLYASGEVACTGVHGGNRLASNSLLEAMVFSDSAARASADDPEPGSMPEAADAECLPESTAISTRNTLQSAMSAHLAVFRSNDGLAEMGETLERLGRDIERGRRAPFSPYAKETENLVEAARHVHAGAVNRKENVGIHFNVDQA